MMAQIDPHKRGISWAEWDRNRDQEQRKEAAEYCQQFERKWETRKAT